MNTPKIYWNYVLVTTISSIIVGVSVYLITTRVLNKRNPDVRVEGGIPKTGELYIIKEATDSTIVIEKACDDDARKHLENHGQG